MPHEIITIDRGDLLYPVKFIVDTNVKSKLSVQKVAKTLARLGFIDARSPDQSAIQRRSRRDYSQTVGMLRDTCRCLISEVEVAFSENVPDEEIETIKAELHALLVTRVEILANAARQNASSGLINLLQNQRRACVSDTYYALHNAVSALQESYLFSGQIDSSKLPEELSRETVDEESRLAHCSPAVGKPIVDIGHLKILWEKDLEEILSEAQLRADRNTRDREPHRSPFVWLSFMLRDLLSGKEAPTVRSSQIDELRSLTSLIVQKIAHLELEPIGIRGKNETPERDFKHVHRELKQLLSGFSEDSDNEKQFYSSLLAFTDFFIFAQILRLSGDYDSSFEIKIRLQNIVEWCLIGSRVTNLVLAYIARDPIKWGDEIRLLPTRCDRRLMGVSDSTSLLGRIASLGGAIQSASYDLVDIVGKLHRLYGYGLTQGDGRTQSVRRDSDEIVLRKHISGFERLVCSLTLQRAGLFWIEVTDEMATDGEKDFRSLHVYTHYLDKILDKYVLENDLLAALGPGATIYRSVSDVPFGDLDDNYAFLLSNLVDARSVTFELRRLIDDEFEFAEYESKNIIYNTIWITSHFDYQVRRPLFLTPRMQDLFRNPRKHPVVLVVPLINLPPAAKEDLEDRVRREVEHRSLVYASLHIEFLTTESIDKALLGDISLLRAYISALVEKVHLATDALSGLLPIRIERRLVNLQSLAALSWEELDSMRGEESLDTPPTLTRFEELLDNQERTRIIAEDIVRHYKELIEPNGFKALIAMPSRASCVRFKHVMDQLLPTESSTVVISSSYNDPDDFRQFARNRQEEAEMLDHFRSPNNPLKFLITTNKLLSGFDAPILQVLYINRPLRGQLLQQAVARVARPYINKEYGLVVDYVGNFDEEFSFPGYEPGE